MLPKRVKIGGLTYEVEVVNGPLVDGGQVLYGQVEYADGKIRICGLYSEQVQETALVHEVLHAIGYEREIAALYGDDAEELVTALARALYAFMVDNGLRFPVSSQ